MQFVFISVDPDRDSVAALRAYATDLGVHDERWAFLRAPLADVGAVDAGAIYPFRLR